MDTITSLSAEAFSAMFDAMPSPAMCCKVLFDGDDAVGILPLYSNTAYKAAHRFGHKEDSNFLARCGRIARGGEAQNFEDVSAHLHGCFATTLYSPAPGHCIAIFREITDGQAIGA